MTIYVIAWTGGYEAAQYAAKATETEAKAQAAEWAKDMADNDTIEILKVEGLNIEREVYA